MAVYLHECKMAETPRQNVEPMGLIVQTKAPRKRKAAVRPSGPAMRTATRKRSAAESASKPGESPQEHQARATHNQVEREYRNRLNGYFERLLKTLPDDSEGSDGTNDGQPRPENGQRRRLSKAEVLQKARGHIQDLEAETTRRRMEISEMRMMLQRANGGSL